MRLGLAEILLKAAEQPNKEQKLEYLRKYDSPALRKVIQITYDPTIKWNLPEGDPPYKPCPYLDQESMLYHELRRLYIFIEGQGPLMSSNKRESLFIQLLESIAPDDAKLVLMMKNKKLSYKGLTIQHFKEAFPGLIEDGQK